MGNQNGWSELGVGKGRRILVVDGASDVRLSLALYLQREGYQVSSAGSAPEALRIMRTLGIPDLIILDIELPEIDGFALAYEIRKHSNVPIVVLSAIADVDTKVEALLEFAEDYVTKPFHVDELAVRIWRILTHYPHDRKQMLGPEARSQTGCRARSPGPQNQTAAIANVHRSRVANYPCASL